MNLDQRLAVAEFFKKRFEKARKDILNPEAAEEMVAGERHASKFAGGVAAWVSMPQPATRVNSQEMLLAWCREHLPEAIEKVDRVRPETARALCEQVKKYGGWIGPDGDRDNVIPVAGIETGDPSPRVELEDEAETLIAAAWRAGAIDLGAMLALGAAPKDGDGPI